MTEINVIISQSWTDSQQTDSLPLMKHVKNSNIVKFRHLVFL